MKVLLILEVSSWKTEINFSRCALFHMKTRVSLNYFASYCRFNSAFSWKSLYIKKDGAQFINLDNKKVKEHIGVSLVIYRDVVVCFDSFGI